MKLYLPWILSGLGLALFLEGSPCFLFPDRMKNLLKVMSNLPDNTLRWSGFAEVCAGALLVWLAFLFSN